MPSILNRLEKKCPKLKNAFNVLWRKPKYFLKHLFFMVGATARKLFRLSHKFGELKKYKNKHLNQRCFIIATGPSLTEADISLLVGEYTFSMNSICYLYKKNGFKPTYYAIQDRNVFEKIKEELFESYIDDTIFVSDKLLDKKKPDAWNRMPINGYYHMYDLLYTDKRYAKFSPNSFSVIYDGYTITYSIIQLAVYMGFKKIYLLGCDCNYSSDPDKQHFIGTGVFDPTYKTAKDRMIVAYKAAKKYADKHDIEIVNCTRGGMLEVFPRKNLEDVLKDKND